MPCAFSLLLGLPGLAWAAGQHLKTRCGVVTLVGQKQDCLSTFQARGYTYGFLKEKKGGLGSAVPVLVPFLLEEAREFVWETVEVLRKHLVLCGVGWGERE